MKKIAFLAAVLGLSVAAHAAPTAAPAAAPAPKPAPVVASSAAPALPLGITAVGYDANLGHVTARIGLTQNNAVDVGVGLNYNSGAAVDKTQIGISGFYLLKLQDWGIVDNYAFAGGVVNIFSDSDLGLSLSAGLQPEITLLDRFIVSVRFGVTVPIAPDFGVATAGQPISIVNGLNFKIIW
jgi:hypothetical protein